MPTINARARMLNPELLEILVCPETKQPVALATPERLEELSGQVFAVIEAIQSEGPTDEEIQKMFGLIMNTGEDLVSADLDALLEGAFERYYRTSGLFGTPEQCIAQLNRLYEIRGKLKKQLRTGSMPGEDLTKKMAKMAERSSSNEASRAALE